MEKITSRSFCRGYLVTALKELLKLVYVCQNYCENKSNASFWDIMYKYLLQPYVQPYHGVSSLLCVICAVVHECCF